MSTSNSKKPKLPVVQLPQQPTLILSDSILAQTSFLHNKIGGVEWSGILFYEILEGGIKDLDNLKMQSSQFMLKDIGTSAATGYEFDESILDFYEEFPETETQKMGMIHTHHNMSNYFSPTDMSELEDNSEHHNYYLSLIMSFDCQYSAKIAFRGQINKQEATVKGDDGEPTTIITRQGEEVLYTCDVFVSHHLRGYHYDQYERILEEKKKEEERQRKARQKQTSNYAGYGGGYYNRGSQIEGFKGTNITPAPGAEKHVVRKTISNLILFDDGNVADVNMFVAIKRVNNELKGESKKFVAEWIDSIELFLDVAVEQNYGDCSEETIQKFAKDAVDELEALRKDEKTYFVKELIKLFELYAQEEIIV